MSDDERDPPPDVIQRWIERRQPWQIVLGSFLAGGALFAAAMLIGWLLIRGLYK